MIYNINNENNNVSDLHIYYKFLVFCYSCNKISLGSSGWLCNPIPPSASFTGVCRHTWLFTAILAVLWLIQNKVCYKMEWGVTPAAILYHLTDCARLINLHHLGCSHSNKLPYQPTGQRESPSFSITQLYSNASLRLFCEEVFPLVSY